MAQVEDKPGVVTQTLKNYIGGRWVEPEGVETLDVTNPANGELLGVVMVGPHATDLISEACLGLRLETTVEELTRTIHPHPTLPEALMQAAENVYGHAIDA